MQTNISLHHIQRKKSDLVSIFYEVTLDFPTLSGLQSRLPRDPNLSLVTIPASFITMPAFSECVASGYKCMTTVDGQSLGEAIDTKKKFSKAKASERALKRVAPELFEEV